MTSKAFGLAQLGNAYADGALSNRNKIINGGFDVWQRGTSFSSASVNEYSADRFRTEGFGLSTTISRQSFTAGQTDVPDFPTYFCRVATSATVGSGQYWSFQQRLEVPQVVSQGQTYTLSFWVRATSGTISAGTLSYGFSSGLVGFPELTTTWQKVTRTLVFGASQISGSFAAAYLVYAPENTAAFSVDIANVQLEAGDTATPFEHRSYGAELALCQRYFRWMPPLQGNFIVGGANTFIAGTSSSLQNMRSLPTFVLVSGAAAIHVSNVANYNITSFNDLNLSYIRVNTNSNPGSYVPGHFNAGNIISMSAEL